MLITEAIWSCIGSVVVGVLSMIGIIYTANSNKRANNAVMKNELANITEQIKSLEKKQDKHNQVIERTYNLETRQAETQRDVKTLYNSLDDVKSDIKDVRNDVEEINRSVNEVKAGEMRLEGKISND